MARLPRSVFPPYGVWHVTTRGVARRAVYLDDDDHRDFLVQLWRAVERFELRALALCLMPNHYHIVLDTPRGNLSDTMQYINGLFARVSNKRYDQTGHVFGDRFRSLLVQSDGYLKRAARYVVRNPVRAQLASHAVEWRWTSYRATAGLEAVPSWLNIEWTSWAFKADTLEEAQRRYVAYVNEPRRATKPRNPNTEVYGSAQFKAQVAAALLERTEERAMPQLVAPQRPPLAGLFVDIGSRKRRNCAIRTARIDHGYRVAEIARFLDLHPSTVTRAIERTS